MSRGFTILTVPRLLPAARHVDHRGWFCEIYSVAAFEDMGIACCFVQDNHSFSRHPYTIRGLHFQQPPYAQDKLVRCLSGRVFDVAVDLRAGSPTYGQWVGAELSAANGSQFFIPAGFAHGFLTLEPDCELSYKVSALYAPQCDGGLRWDDPAIAIDWPLPTDTAPTLSDKDAGLPALSDFRSPFPYDGTPMPTRGLLRDSRHDDQGAS